MLAVTTHPETSQTNETDTVVMVVVTAVEVRLVAIVKADSHAGLGNGI